MVFGSDRVSSGYHFAPSPRLHAPPRQGFVPLLEGPGEVKEGLLALCPTGSVLLAHGHLCSNPYW